MVAASSAAAVLLVMVCPLLPADASSPATESAMLRHNWEASADPLVREINSAAVAASAAAGATPGGPYGLAQTPYMGWRRCAEAVAPSSAIAISHACHSVLRSVSDRVFQQLERVPQQRHAGTDGNSHEQACCQAARWVKSPRFRVHWCRARRQLAGLRQGLQWKFSLCRRHAIVEYCYIPGSEQHGEKGSRPGSQSRLVCKLVIS
jgi:hypothetical protein